MSEREELDLTEFVKDDKVFLDHLRIENYKIKSTAYKSIIFIGCSFVNVVFEGHPEEWGGMVVFVGCDAKQCVFHGDLGNRIWKLKFIGEVRDGRF